MYVGDALRVPYRLKIIKHVIEESKARTILDVGCGDGKFTEAILAENLGLNIHCVEPDLNRATEAAERLGKYGVMVSNRRFEDFYLPRTWNLCMFNGVLEHLDDPVRALQRAGSFAKYVFAIVPNAYSLHRIVGCELGIVPYPTFLSDKDKEVGHQRYYTPTELFKDLADADLILESFGGIMLKPLSDRQMLNWTAPTLQLLFDLGEKVPLNCAELWVLARRKSG